MSEWIKTRCTAFNGSLLIASGELADVAISVKAAFDGSKTAIILVFNDITGETIEIDNRGTVAEVLKRLTEQGKHGSVTATSVIETSRGPGRPKLGVIAREVTLLPRHWDWLNSQPGGASVALRKLVEEARRVNDGKDRVRQSREAGYRFMAAMSGELRGLEEASRALFAGNQERFNELVESWPSDIRDYARKLASPSFREQSAVNESGQPRNAYLAQAGRATQV